MHNQWLLADAAPPPVVLPLAPRRSEELNLALISQNVDAIILVTDQQMRQAARWLWQEW